MVTRCSSLYIRMMNVPSTGPPDSAALQGTGPVRAPSPFLHYFSYIDVDKRRDEARGESPFATYET